jgi:hypothetical protein
MWVNQNSKVTMKHYSIDKIVQSSNYLPEDRIIPELLLVS